jgi:hypothetical protein
MTTQFTTLLRTKTTFAAAITFAAVVSMGSARADATCPALINSVVNTLQSKGGGYYNVEMTMHRTDVALVTYSNGRVALDGTYAGWPLLGYTNQLFSDRLNGSQRFNQNAADQLTIYISETGLLYIYYDTWHFVTDWDMSCTGNTLTKVIPGFGVVSFTFRNWATDVQ